MFFQDPKERAKAVIAAAEATVKQPYDTRKWWFGTELSVRRGAFGTDRTLTLPDDAGLVLRFVAMVLLLVRFCWYVRLESQYSKYVYSREAYRVFLITKKTKSTNE